MDAGTIEMLGRPFGRGDRRRLFEVGALVETPSFYPYLSGRENLRALAAAGPATPKTRISEVLELVGLTDRAGDKVSRYSLGMKQRLGIAGALLSDPKLLLLDEPANGLDPAGIVAMRETLKHFASTGKTVFVSSHLLAEVQQLADVVGIIAAGKLVREGTMKDLLATEGVVRVRVTQDEVPRAMEVLAGPDGPEPGRGVDVGPRLAVGPDHAGPGGRDQPCPESGRDLRVGPRGWQRPRGALPDAHPERIGRRSGWHVRRTTASRRGSVRLGGRMRIFVSTLRKLIRRPATVVTFALMAGLLVLILLAVASTRGVGQGGGGGNGNDNGAATALLLLTFPGAYDLILGFILGLGGLFAVIYGAAVAGSEWTWGTLKSTVARGESRSLYALMTFVAIAFILAVGLLATFVIGVLVGALGATIAGLPLDGLSDSAALGRLPEHFLRGWVAISAEAAIGFTVATLARSQLAGIGVGIALYFGETFASIFLPDIVKYLPFHLANTAVGEGGGGAFGNAPAPGALSPDTALVLISVWLLGSLVVAAAFTDRAEITG